MRAIRCSLLALALPVAACSLGSPASPVAANVLASSGATELAPDSGDASDPSDAGDPFASCPSSAPATGTIPTDVDAVLKDRCQTCHSAPPVMDAPFALVTFADIHKEFDGVLPIYEEMHFLIQPGADPHMPFGNAPQLSSDQFSTLDSWLEACAPSGN